LGKRAGKPSKRKNVRDVQKYEKSGTEYAEIQVIQYLTGFENRIKF
jgi:hypothetical protein